MKTPKKNQKIKLNRAEGIISISSRGTGYVAVGEDKSKTNDPEIDFKHLNTALHGDKVQIIFHPRNLKSKRRQTAEVSKIITRAKMNYAGVLEKEKNLIFLKPDDTKMYTDILIPKENLRGGKAGQKAFVQITSWNDPRKAPIGKVLKILGKPGDNDAEMHAIAMEKGFDAEFPAKVEAEAKKIKAAGIKQSDLVGRKDFRKVLTFTIDPSDAKDFDDAISFRILPSLEKEGVGGGNSKKNHLAPRGTPPQKGGEELYEVGIHIADVSHYVRPGSALDREAAERGTSVYLVDRTIPMLPEILSNDLCSLVPNADRLTMSAVFVMDKNAKVKSEWFGKTVIHSKKRFTYEQAEESIKDAKKPLHKELAILNDLAKKLNKERFHEGAMSLEQEEVRFVLNMYGVPIDIVKKERGQSNKLIEEFMLLANRSVAKLISGTEKSHKKNDEQVSIYRVHDLPSKEKMEDLAFFLRSLGYKVSLVDGIIPPKEINALLASLAGKPEADAVNRAVIKSMAKAIYSTKNIGHYGLAFEYYTHFTSPIRRYPDIIVHRLLQDFLEKKKIKNARLPEFEKMARVASEQEKRATDAERSSVKYKQVEYMSKRTGQIFTGIISSITEWGLYVEEVESKCEGLVRLRDMKDDYYVFNEKKFELVGEKSKKRYRLGDRVKIKVRSVDLEKKTIDYVLV